MRYRQNIHIQIAPKTWLGRLLALAVAAVLLILGFFFLTFVLIMLGVMIFAVLVRLLLPSNKAQGQTPEGAIEGEYSVEPDERKAIDVATHTGPKQ